MAYSIQHLKQDLSASGGRALVLMHPFFHESHPNHYPLRQDPSVSRRGQRFLRSIQLTVQRTHLPIIVFEERGKVRATRARLKGEFNKRVFVLPTHLYSPTPVGDWQKHLDALEDAGLKHAILGGQKLGYFPKSFLRKQFESALAEDPNSARDREALVDLDLIEANIAGALRKEDVPWSHCVGTVAKRFLRRGIRVSIMPNASYSPIPIKKPVLVMNK